MTISVVQSVALCGGGQPIFTLPSAPTNGNYLIFLGSHYSGTSSITTAANWIRLLEGPNAADDIVCVYIRPSTGIGSTTQQPFTDASPRGFSGVLFEVSSTDTYPSITIFAEASRSTITLSKPSSTAATALLGMFSTTGNNTLPTITGDATTQQTAQGTSANASPRGITGVFAAESTAAQTSTATWGSALNTYGLLAVLSQPSVSSSRVAAYVTEGPATLSAVSSRVAMYVIEGPPTSSNKSQPILGSF